MNADASDWFVVGMGAVWACWSLANISYRLRQIGAALDRLVTLAESGRR